MTNKTIDITKGLKGILPLLLLLIFAACEKEVTDIGVGLRPDGGVIGSDMVMLNKFKCRTIKEDSLRTDSLRANSLGAIIDPLFGTRISSLIIQPQLEALNYDFTGAGLDSVVLTVKYLKTQLVDASSLPLVYGDLTSNMKVDVYLLDEDLISENRYYSDFNPTLGLKVGTYDGAFMFYDSTWDESSGDSVLVTPQMRIKLDNTFGQDILDQATTVFASSDNFKDYLKGLVLVPDVSGMSVNQGSIVGINAATSETQLTVYYDDTLTAKFPTSGSSERINLWEIQNQAGQITTQENVDGHYNSTYVQTLDGNKVKIDLEQIDSFIENTTEQIVINEAVIELSVDASTVTAEYPAPYRLLLAIPDTAGRTAPFIDFIDDAFPISIDWVNLANYGGRYNDSKGSYTFHFNRYLQALLEEYQETGVNNFRGFLAVIPSDNPLIASRIVLNTDGSNGGIKVSVSYTKLN